MDYFNKQAFLNSQAGFKKAPSGFRFGYVPNVFKEEVYGELVKSFPDVSGFKLVNKQSGGGLKRFYIGSDYNSYKNKGCPCVFYSEVSEIWKNLIKESDSDEFKSLLKTVTGVSFNTLMNFGFTFGNEGCMQEAHIDGEVRDLQNSKLPAIACLLYFNANPDPVGGTCVYGTDRETVLFQVPHLKNGLCFFEQHPDAWHGFPTMPQGAERRLISLAYNTEKSAIPVKDYFPHSLFCAENYKNKIKKLIR